ncbi:hypothetical protein [Mycobacterium uberis]|uniref:hypothetical protein n=1 Tax=Mycobacterium uberis TaxID=2162698 RepID=UPI001402C829|nr:hypothetical protein [Mycobacterium uberis]
MASRALTLKFCSRLACVDLLGLLTRHIQFAVERPGTVSVFLGSGRLATQGGDGPANPGHTGLVDIVVVVR